MPLQLLSIFVSLAYAALTQLATELFIQLITAAVAIQRNIFELLKCGSPAADALILPMSQVVYISTDTPQELITVQKAQTRDVPLFGYGERNAHPGPFESRMDAN